MSEPGRTRILAVGISSYALGDSWRLPNAAEHAVEFALWARRRGVPAANVHLFLSTADHARLAGALAGSELQPRRATFADITAFAFQELTGLSGDVLYVFWAGHGSVSEDGLRVLFFEDLTERVQLPFDLNDFFARLRTSSFHRFETQIAFVDACANRFEELGFDASLGTVKAGKGRTTHAGLRQSFFLAADSGEQAREGAFGAAVLAALAAADPAVWPPEQAHVVDAVRPQFEGAFQHPVQLVWTSTEGDWHVRERVSGELPASRSVNAAAFARRVPVRALRRLADIALQYGALGDATLAGAAARDELYAAVCSASGRASAHLRRSTPRVEMLHLIGAALQWNLEGSLANALGRLAPAAEFSVELERLALIQDVRALVGGLPATGEVLQTEYRKTISRLGREAPRDDAATIDAMLDELYQISAAIDPQRPVWEFLMRLADRYPACKPQIDRFLGERVTTPVTLHTLREELSREQLFVLSISVSHAHSDAPGIDAVDARLVIAGTDNLVGTFAPQPVTAWEEADAVIAGIVRTARTIVLQQYRREESALLVEFLMPAPFLVRAPDRVPVKVGPVTRPLGRLHPVVLRLRERIAQRADAINLDEWEAISRRIDRERPAIVHWMDRTRATPTIDTCQGVVALRFLPSDELLDIVCDGFPFMAWLRSDPLTGTWDEFARRFEAWAQGRPVKALARDVRSFRRAIEPLGADLALLWDDPDETGHWLLGDVVEMKR